MTNNLFDCCAKRSRCKIHVATEREVQTQRQLTKSCHQGQIIKEPKQHSPTESAMDKEASGVMPRGMVTTTHKKLLGAL